MDLEKLFERVGYTDGGADTERLFRLHRAFAFTVPFENIDVYNGKELSLKPEDLFEKVVTRRRGGYCFEMNTFFCAVLREMGYSVYGLLTRLSRGGMPFGGYVHRTNLVEADGMKYLCDVGFGSDCFVEPLRFELDVIQETHGSTYRIVPGTDPSVEYTVEKLQDTGFEPLMGFIDRPAKEDDFVIANYHMNLSPTSPFRNFLMLNRFTETGRYSMMNLSFTCQEGERIEHRAVSWEELPGVLEKYFGLTEAPDHPPAPPRL